jgi:hypothetical protein
MTLQGLADAEGKTPFELFSDAYKWRWGTQPLSRTVEDHLRRAAKAQTVPSIVRDYVGRQTPTLPARAFPA